MKKQMTIRMLLIWAIVSAAPSLASEAGRIYHLGPVRVELISLPQNEKNTLYFDLTNTTGSPVRYFSITCKIMKDGYMIDERICNGFGIAPNDSKRVQATFLWLPPEFEVAFEANKIRTEETVISGNDATASPQERAGLIEVDGQNESDESDPSADLVHSDYEIGRKYTLYHQGTWFSGK